MTGSYIFSLIFFAGVLIWEYSRPFQKKETFPIKHFCRNVFFAALTGGVAFLFISGYEQLSSVIDANQWGILKPTFIGPIFFILLMVILFDAWMYFWHRLNHEIPFLWRFHRMHHTDLSMDATTAFRFHPIEILFSNMFNVLILVIIGMTYNHLLLYNAFLYPVILFHHSNIDFPERWDRVLRVVIVSPHMHKLHHSQIMTDTNSNYGSIFSVWDRLFGSINLRDKIDDIVYGIGIYKGEKSQNIWGMLQVPFRK